MSSISLFVFHSSHLYLTNFSLFFCPLLDWVFSLATFYFEIILDSQKSCKDSTECSYILFIQFSLMLTFYINMAYLSKLRNSHWYNMTNYRLHLDFLINAFFCFRISPRIPHFNQSSCLLRFLLAMTVSQTFLVFDDLYSFGNYESGILQNVPISVCLVSSLDQSVVIDFGEGYHRGMCPCYPSYQGGM